MLSLCVLSALVASAGCRRTGAGKASAPPPIVRTSTGIEMVSIPGGSFLMGSEAGQPDESPVHEVRLSPFLMDRFEVVQEQFKRYQLPDPSHFKDPNAPLDQINWTDAAMYCNERSRAEGFEPCYDDQTWQCNFDANGYRLPTEAEWEYACRAGTSGKYHFGDNARKLDAYAWTRSNSSGRTHPVGRKKPNPWGLYDMYGNVAEWCNDFYSQSYYRRSETQDPTGPPRGAERVIRGGAWNSSPQACRSASRSSDPSLNDTCLASDTIGFRCVRRVVKVVSTERKMKRENQQVRKLKTAIVYDEVYLEHETTAGHPERPERLLETIETLRVSGVYDELLELKPTAAPLEWVAAVHSTEYIQRVRSTSEDAPAYLDSADVPVSRRSYEVALMAAGGVLRAVDAIMAGQAANAFCAVRPPGHHALESKAMGFCIFNNVAIGARYVQGKYKLPRVLIVDWDVHHGNGTEAEFYDDPNVLYFSVHQYPFYPGTGAESDRGRGEGLGSTINVPLPAGSGGGVYLETFEKVLRPAAMEFRPDFLFISAGFDAHRHDLLGGMDLTAEGFAELTEVVMEIAEKCCEGRLVSVLEGGYNIEALAACVEAHIRVLMR